MKKDKRPDTYTLQEVLTILKNSGVDVKCGACMEVAFTGQTTSKHSCVHGEIPWGMSL